ncbi:hypothetical protein K9N68_09655 [Kovacikia minuta CCNUW1]|nr:hypothetical protein [Kovacikia minuta]UBF28118.1 hypothetical protein K9N68_09655 [Kovacikia minuta CCNUW1]
MSFYSGFWMENFGWEMSCLAAIDADFLAVTTSSDVAMTAKTPQPF